MYPTLPEQASRSTLADALERARNPDQGWNADLLSGLAGGGPRIPKVYSHEPPHYECPFCRLADGEETPLNGPRDVVSRSQLAVAFISPRWWPDNRGHVLVVPAAHYENLYDLPALYGYAVHDLVQAVAGAMRCVYSCDGITTRQHNEPAGGQDVWHHHVHVFPRYHGDDLYRSSPEPGYAAAQERWEYAARLRRHLDC